MVKFWRSFILCHIFAIYIFATVFVDANPPDKIEIKISHGGVLINVVAKKAPKSLLISKSLPVWQFQGDGKLPYQKLDVIGKDLGELTPYYNEDNETALIYSPICNCVSGIVTIWFYLYNVPLGDFEKTLTPSNNPSDHINYRSRKILQQNLTENSDYTTEVKDPELNKRAKDKTLYPEILVILKNDFFIGSHKNESLKILYTISLINAANMFYLGVKDLKLEINIAGIIIENIPNKFSDGSTSNLDYLQTNKLIANIKNSDLLDKSNFNSKISFDSVFILTSKTLRYNTDEVLRMTAYPSRGVVMAKISQRKCGFITPISIITDQGSYKSYPTIAHEIYHLINQGSDIYGGYDSCAYRYYTTFDDPLAPFQWSNDCCLLTNEPNSLNTSLMTPNKQCSCYGYDFKGYDMYPCTDILNCNDEHNNDIPVARIVKSVDCPNDKKLVSTTIAPRLSSTTIVSTTTTAISMLKLARDTWPSIEEDKLSGIAVIFDAHTNSSVHSSFLCTGVTTVLSNKEDDSEKTQIAIVPKTCILQNVTQYQVRQYTLKKEPSNEYFLVAEAGNHMNLEDSKEYDNYGAKILYFEQVFSKLNAYSYDALLDTRSKKDLRSSDCHLIHLEILYDQAYQYKIKFIPLKIKIECENSCTIESTDPISDTITEVFLGNILYCKVGNESLKMIGILREKINNKLQFDDLGYLLTLKLDENEE